jgi:hypothetical protein
VFEAFGRGEKATIGSLIHDALVQVYGREYTDRFKSGKGGVGSEPRLQVPFVPQPKAGKNPVPVGWFLPLDLEQVPRQE